MLRTSTRRLAIALATALAALLTAGAGTASAAIFVSVESPLGGNLAEGQVVPQGRIASASVDVAEPGVPSSAQCIAFLAGVTATIDWGDGSPAEGLLPENQRSAGAGQCTLDFQAPSHRYVVARAAPYDITVTVTQGATSGTGHRLVQVIDVPFGGEVEAFGAVAGQPFTGVVGEIRDDNEFSDVGQFSAVIDWGDGSASTATLGVDRPGRYDVIGSHTYLVPGTYVIVVQVTHAGLTVPLEPATVVVGGGGPGVTPPPVAPGPPGPGDDDFVISPTFSVRSTPMRKRALRRRGALLRIGLGAFRGRSLPLRVRVARRGRITAIARVRLRLRGARTIDAAGRIVQLRWRPPRRVLRRMRPGTTYGLRTTIGQSTLQDALRLRPRR